MFGRPEREAAGSARACRCCATASWCLARASSEIDVGDAAHQARRPTSPPARSPAGTRWRSPARATPCSASFHQLYSGTPEPRDRRARRPSSARSSPRASCGRRGRARAPRGRRGVFAAILVGFWGGLRPLPAAAGGLQLPGLPPKAGRTSTRASSRTSTRLDLWAFDRDLVSLPRESPFLFNEGGWFDTESSPLSPR